MKVLISNKFYYPRGGDCIYAINLEQLLKQHGHETAVFAMQHPENCCGSHCSLARTPWAKYFPSEVRFTPGRGLLRWWQQGLEAVFRPFGTREVKQKFHRLLDDFGPDVVHLNNIHSQLSPVIAQIAHERQIKVVWTLHDYKLLCPRYDCRRNDREMCELCFTDKSNVLKYRCMKNSLFASFIAWRESLKWSKEKLENFTDAFICPSRFMKEKMIQGGFQPDKLHTLCNFIDVNKTERDDYTKENYYCYVGRLSSEKGVKTLVEAAKQLPFPLKIVGTGPLWDELQQSSCDHIEFLGYKQWEEIKEVVGRARFLVIPSEWYENNPLTVIEALCLGTPVLGANIGGIPELIDEEQTGLLFESRNVEDLKEKIERIWEQCDPQSFASTFDYQKIAKESQQRFSSDHYYNQLMNIYTSL